MRAFLFLAGVAALGLVAAMAFGFVRFDQTRTAQLPRFNADVARVSVGTENRTVEVPRVQVDKPAQR